MEAKPLFSGDGSARGSEEGSGEKGTLGVVWEVELLRKKRIIYGLLRMWLILAGMLSNNSIEPSTWLGYEQNVSSFLSHPFLFLL